MYNSRASRSVDKTLLPAHPRKTPLKNTFEKSGVDKHLYEFFNFTKFPFFFFFFLV
jgi:hypothetical protein